MSTRYPSSDLADELNRQLEDRRPMYVNELGELVEQQAVEDTDEGPVDKRDGRVVTRVKPHRVYAWYETNRQRLSLETETMAQRFPDFVLKTTDRGLTWAGQLRTNSGSRYQIAVVYSTDFPYYAPKVYVLRPPIRSPKHQWNDGSLCLFNPDDKTWNTNTTAAQAVALTAEWLFSYEYHEQHCHQGLNGGPCSTVPCSAWPGQEAHY